MRRPFINLALFLVISQGAFAEEAVTLDEVLHLAFANSSELASVERSVVAQRSLVTSQYSPEDPMFGVATLDRGNFTRYAVVSQRLRFPVKYYLQGRAQGSRADSSAS
ncbi:MAG: hypothetical protein KDD43_09510, partial [Bdellovibrionales bacterium]|nr:hypothetical protein [Bdellovibrionales bacterium]